MMLPYFEELFKPYTEDGATLEGTVNWLLNKCKIPSIIVERVLQETMLKLADGVTFSTDGCSCGCEIKNAHTAIEHYMRDRCIQVSKEANEAFHKAVQGNLKALILNHISLDNQKFTSEAGVVMSAKYPSKWQKVKSWIGLR